MKMEKNNKNLENEIKVRPEELEILITDVFTENDVPKKDALIVAKQLIFANLRGVDTHGIVRLKGYIDRINAGGNNPTPKIRITKETGISAVVDGDSSLGQVGGYYAMTLAIQKAKEAGIGMVAIRNSNHYGMASFYSMMPLEHDMIGISMTNVLACMAPIGGTEAKIGNNVISFAFPSDKKSPVILDMSTSKSSWGVAMLSKLENKPLPEKCFADSKGVETTDPNEFLSGGTLYPTSSYKGFGLAYIISIFCSLLSDGKFDTDLPHLYKKLGEPGENSFFMMAIKIDNFTNPLEFKTRIDWTINLLKESTILSGFDDVYFPGEIEYRRETERNKNGIPIGKSQILELIDLIEKSKNLKASNYPFLNK